MEFGLSRDKVTCLPWLPNLKRGSLVKFVTEKSMARRSDQSGPGGLQTVTPDTCLLMEAAVADTKF
jgi:hypothetical protein